MPDSPPRPFADRVREVAGIRGLRRPRRIPVVEQTGATECGLACLASVLAFHGRHLPVRALRDHLTAGRDGTTAADLLHLAEKHRLAGRGLRVDAVEDLRRLQRGAILHWRFSHFVVLDRALPKGLEVMDPAMGRRRVRWEEVSRNFTGVALELWPTDTFRKRKPGKRGVLRDYARVILRSGHLPQLLMMSAAIQVLGTATPLFTALLVDRIVPREDRGLLLTVAIALLGIAAFSTLFSFLRSRLTVEVMSRIDARLTVAFVERLMELPFSYLQNRSSGDLMLRMNSHVQIRNALTSTAFSAVLDGLFVLSYLVLMLLTDAVVTTLVVVLGMLRIAVFVVTRVKQRELVTESIQRQAEARSYQVRMLSGMEALKSMGAEREVARKWTDLFVRELNIGIAQNRIGATVGAVNGALSGLGTMAILVVGALRVLDGHMTLGVMLAMNAFAMGFLGPLSSLVGTVSTIYLLGSYVDRVEDVIATEPEARAPAGTPEVDVRAVEMQHVSFRYSDAGPEVLDDISFRVGPGRFAAFVGPSGAGKSTVAKLLLGLYAPTRGHVIYGGADLAGLDLREVRRKIGTVTQAGWYAADSVRENIALGNPEMSLAEVIEAAKHASIHEDIAKLPMGYDTILYDGGFLMSGGQMQRLALARALAKRPPMLILDEATSHLDPKLEARIQKRLASLKCTRIVIAQRLRTIEAADCIFVLKEGRIVERGRHRKLMGLDGEYAALVRAGVSRR